jgi:16S rRNA (uracil1498-N3)-methyltransferase
MEAIYIKDLSSERELYEIQGDEFNHLKALRVRAGEKILAINGEGLAAEGIISDIDKRSASISFHKYIPEYNETGRKIGMALGILSSKDRFEFAVEKAVELGATHIIPFTSRYSSQNKINNERIRLKMIAALKQCKRSRLPELSPLIKIEKIFEEAEFEKFILCDPDGIKPAGKNLDNVCAIIGPEGGFSNEEIEFLEKNPNLIVWKLGVSRLRAETAAISALSLLAAL